MVIIIRCQAQYLLHYTSIHELNLNTEQDFPSRWHVKYTTESCRDWSYGFSFQQNSQQLLFWSDLSRVYSGKSNLTELQQNSLNSPSVFHPRQVKNGGKNVEEKTLAYLKWTFCWSLSNVLCLSGVSRVDTFHRFYSSSVRKRKRELTFHASLRAPDSGLRCFRMFLGTKWRKRCRNGCWHNTVVGIIKL